MLARADATDGDIAADRGRGRPDPGGLIEPGDGSEEDSLGCWSSPLSPVTAIPNFRHNRGRAIVLGQEPQAVNRVSVAWASQMAAAGLPAWASLPRPAPIQR
jgi:hypothetical protein